MVSLVELATARMKKLWNSTVTIHYLLGSSIACANSRNVFVWATCPCRSGTISICHLLAYVAAQQGASLFWLALRRPWRGPPLAPTEPHIISKFIIDRPAG